MGIAVVGAGLSGLTAAWALAKAGHEVTLLERHARPGFVASAVSVPYGGQLHEVDLPLRVFYPGYYPTLLRLYAQLGAATEPIDYASTFASEDGTPFLRYRNLRLGKRSFSYVLPGDMVGARGRRCVAGAVRFHAESKRALQAGELRGLSLGQYLQGASYSREFTEGLLIPTVATICTCPNEVALRFPAEIVAQYFSRGVASQSVQRAVNGAQDAAARLLAPVKRFVAQAQVQGVERRGNSVWLVREGQKRQRFDHIVLASSAQHSLRLLGQGAEEEECTLLSSIEHHPVDVVLHRDASLMPPERKDWSPINAFVGESLPQPMASIWINAVQPSLRDAPDLFQSVAPLRPPKRETVLGQARFERPVVNARSLAALTKLTELHAQTERRLWFCGSYAKPGIPLLEAAVVSALDVVRRIDASAAADL